MPQMDGIGGEALSLLYQSFLKGGEEAPQKDRVGREGRSLLYQSLSDGR